MSRICSAIAALVSIFSTAFASSPDTTTLAKDCDATIGPLLAKSDGRLTPSVRKAYLDWAEQTALQELKQANQTVPSPCLTEIHGDQNMEDAIFGAVFPPDPSILQNYAQLCSQLGPDFLRKYRFLVLAVSISRRVKGVESDPKTIGKDYQLDFWQDESLQHVDGDDRKQLVQGIADFMKEKQVAALDLYQSADIQKQLAQYLSDRKVSQDLINQAHTSVQFGEWIKNAMVLDGQRPAARDPKPDPVTWLKHIGAIFESAPSSVPSQMSWPLFPVMSAPWPLLMPLAHAVPISEANYVWEAFQGQHGDDRYHTYGPYFGDDDLILHSLNPSKWFWDAWPDRIIHGGECIPISKGTVDLYSSLDKPAMWAGQPGHANLISFQATQGKWFAEVEQAFAGGPDATSAQWYFDEDPGTELQFRDMFYWPGAEYHLGLALAMNVGLGSYMDTRIAANIYRVLPDVDKETVGVKLLTHETHENPFNPELWFRLAVQSKGTAQGLNLLKELQDGVPSRFADKPVNYQLEDFMQSKLPPQVSTAATQYWQTTAEYVARYALLDHPAPQGEGELQRTYGFLKAVPGLKPNELADYLDSWEAIGGGEAVIYDQGLLSQGDSYGILRMAQRYRDGRGVQLNGDRAKQLFAEVAAHGDMTAAVDLERMYAVVGAGDITVTASSTYTDTQSVQHLINGAGMTGFSHDNSHGAETMWHTGSLNLTAPAPGLAPSPAWVRFDFSHPRKLDSILIWNISQPGLTDRGFRHTHIYGLTEADKWIPITPEIEIPRAIDGPIALPVEFKNEAADTPIKSVIIAADVHDGNYGSVTYGLDAVRFAVPHLPPVVPVGDITVTASDVFSPEQTAFHLISGEGLEGLFHDNEIYARDMWQTRNDSTQPPAPGLPVSPAWVRFDFADPYKLASILIWNHNQLNLSNRGFRKTRIYGTSDGTTWFPLTSTDVIELPRATAQPGLSPFSIKVADPSKEVKGVVIAAESGPDGKYGGDCYGLSAVRFVTR